MREQFDKATLSLRLWKAVKVTWRHYTRIHAGADLATVGLQRLKHPHCSATSRTPRTPLTALRGTDFAGGVVPPNYSDRKVEETVLGEVQGGPVPWWTNSY
jgi:hypothetical protein